MRGWIKAFCLVLVMASPAKASAAQASEVSPQVPTLGNLARCKAVADGPQRLSCYDQAAAALLAAEQRSDIVLVARQQVERTRRATFGFNVPELAVLRGRGGQPETLDQIQGVLASSAEDASGQWTFSLRDGSVWQQVDINPLTITPRPGDPVLVRRAGLGGYRLSVARAPGVRVRRVR